MKMATKSALGERIPIDEQIRLTNKKRSNLSRDIIAYRTLFKDTLQRMLEEKGIVLQGLSVPCIYSFDGISVKGRLSFSLNTKCGTVPFSEPLNPVVLDFKSDGREDNGSGLPFVWKKFETSEDDYFAFVERAVLPCLSPVPKEGESNA